MSGPKNSETPAPTETARLDWLLAHSPTLDRNGDSFVIVAWIQDGRPGNEEGPNGLFAATGSSYRECIDRFLSGNISRAD